MRLLEHEAKALFRQHGLQVPKGFTATSVHEVERSLGGLGAGEVVVKAQVPIAGRRKAGAVKLVPAHAAPRAAADLLLRRFKGFECREVLVEEKVPVKEERFLSLAINGSARRVECLYSESGGVEVEELAKRGAPLQRVLVNTEADLEKLRAEREVVYAAKHLYRLMLATDAELVEANPLALTERGDFVALDAKVVVDDNALFRHPHLEAKRLARMPQLERKAVHAGLRLVRLGGEVAVVGNGAGLVMSVVDSLQELGARPACFLDLGGGSGKDSVAAALEVARELKPRVILVVVFGGITRAGEVAAGLLGFLRKEGKGSRVVAFIEGTGEREARSLLARGGVRVFRSLKEAVEEAAAAAAGDSE